MYLCRCRCQRGNYQAILIPVLYHLRISHQPIDSVYDHNHFDTSLLSVIGVGIISFDRDEKDVREIFERVCCTMDARFLPKAAIGNSIPSVNIDL